MSDGLDTSWVATWIGEASALVGQHRVELNRLDRDIGDGDHGENLVRGFRAAQEKIADGSEESPSALLKSVGATLISTVGGAAGPLYGTAFLKGAQAVSGSERLGPEDVACFIEAASEGLQRRGHAEPGDKTMVDAWHPAAEAARSAADDGDTVQEVLRRAAAAAESGAEATEPLEARKGRASYLGKRSIGHRDPGAESSAVILRSAATTAKELA